MLIWLTGLVACSSADRLPVNLQHALALVDSVQIDQQVLYYITIYANHPDYKPLDAAGEGIACVDDVGRFLEVLQVEVLQHGKRELLPMVRGMTNFLLYMSRPDGLWYNFLLPTGQINTTHPNSRAEFGWWAVRGLRGLAAAYAILKVVEPQSALLGPIKERIAAGLHQVESTLRLYPQLRASALGLVPAWLVRDAPDMNSELLLALTNIQKTGDFQLLPVIERLAEGICGYQFRQAEHPLDGMYLCWENLWHAWGSNQAYALLQAYQLTGDTTILKSVCRWADHFVPFWLANNQPNTIRLNPDGSYTVETFPQIAYGVHAVYSGIKSLADVTGSPRYRAYAEQVFGWFTGRNIAKMPLYDPQTGRVYDGLDAADKVNRNSGAESTIEGLGAIQKSLVY